MSSVYVLYTWKPHYTDQVYPEVDWSARRMRVAGFYLNDERTGIIDERMLYPLSSALFRKNRVYL